MATDSSEPFFKDDVGAFIALLPIACGIAVVFMLFQKPTEPPPASSLRGCFAAARAGVIEFDRGRVSFGKGGIGPMSYKMRLEKYGLIDVEMEPAVRLERGPRDAYSFVKGETRWLSPIQLKHIIGGKPYGVLAVADAEYIDVMAEDGEEIHFRPAASSACVSG